MNKPTCELSRFSLLFNKPIIFEQIKKSCPVASQKPIHPYNLDFDINKQITAARLICVLMARQSYDEYGQITVYVHRNDIEAI